MHHSIALMAVAAASLAFAAQTCNFELKNPIPQSTTCGVAGNLKKYSILQSFDNPPKQFFCSDACASHKKCKSFSSTADGAKCTLYSKSLAVQGFKSDSSATKVYYDRTCFKCTTTATCPSSRNMLQNPGFEVQDTILPWAFDPNGQTQGFGFFAPGSDGTGKAFNTQVINENSSGNTFQSAVRQQFLPCDNSDVKYVIKFDYNFSKSKSQAFLRFGLYGFLDQIVTNTVPSDTWLTYTSNPISRVAGQDAVFYFVFSNTDQNDGEFFAVDNVSVRPYIF